MMQYKAFKKKIKLSVYSKILITVTYIVT